MKQRMNVAPTCQWKNFREWVLTGMSCRLNAFRLNSESRQDWTWIDTSFELLVEHMEKMPKANEKMHASVDLFGIYELIYWMSTFKEVPIPTAHLHPQQVFQPVVLEISKAAHKLGICQNRLWNLAIGCTREQDDLPALIALAKTSPQATSYFKHKEPEARGPALDHDVCTSEFCKFSDINSTSVKQLHKCKTRNCNEFIFLPRSEFERSTGQYTWWLDRNNNPDQMPRIVSGRYVAISHVWSDGTGVGVQEQGRVNRCLFEFFAQISDKMGCKAIWWDTISIPIERKARAKAINRMHENYEQAAHTIVHDEYLIQFPWADDGSPCLALVLSPWFTRGWTALELIKSNKDTVWVLFRDPNDPQKHVIKNLEAEILASHPFECSLGHLVASSIVRRLRDQRLRSLTDMMAVLRTRSTSWRRDQMIIAGLLAGHQIETGISDFQSQLTRDILLCFVEIEAGFLLHGLTPMVQKGGFSWCPLTIFDGHTPHERAVSDVLFSNKLYIDEQGAVSGAWKFHILEEKDVNKLKLHSFHISNDWRIRVALRNWQHCLVLRPLYSDRRPSPALLVTVIEIGDWHINKDNKRSVVDCRYVGSVYEELAWPSTVQKISIRLGKNTKDPYDSAQTVLSDYDWKQDVPFPLNECWWIVEKNEISEKRMRSIKEKRLLGEIES